MVTVYMIYLYSEPFLCLCYVWLMWRIKRSNAEELQSPFFKFFICCGIASCMNVLIITLKRFENDFIPAITSKSIRDYIFNIFVFCSHCFSLSHTIGKIFVVASRFTAICYPLKNVWTNSRLRLSICLMFLIPAILYSFMIPLDAIYRVNQAGNLIYIGVDVWAQQLSKLISATSYILFIILSFPMCAASVYTLRKAQMFNPHAFEIHERALLFYTIVIALAHLAKSGQQIFWFITMVIPDDVLFDLATSLYNIANALTTFVPPLLLITTSKTVRYEFICFGRRPHYNPTVGQSASFRSGSTQEQRPAQE